MIYIIILSPLFVVALFFISPKRKGVCILLNTIKWLSSLVLVLLFLRLYWFDIYKIPSESMEQTLIVGDKIIIRKNTVPQHNDIVVFRSMNIDTLVLVKRCVGMPGDTLNIHQNAIFVNDKALLEPLSLQWTYAYDSLDIKVANVLINRPIKTQDGNLLLTSGEASALNVEMLGVNLKKQCKAVGKTGRVFPRNKQFSNNRDNFSPFVVPAKGLTLELDSVRALWYRKYIKLENPSARIDKSGLVTINNISSRNYTFKNNYYYMMGDNRHYSCDSRYFGFISSSHIQGKVIYIWSHNNN